MMHSGAMRQGEPREHGSGCDPGPQVIDVPAAFGRGARPARWLACLLLAVPLASSAARHDWRELSVGRLTIYSTHDDTVTRSIATSLELFESTIGTGLQNTHSRLPDVPTYVYILRSSDFYKYAGWSGVAGFFVHHAFENVIVFNGDRPFAETSEGVFHEYAHYLQANVQNAAYPPWYREGFALVLQTFRVHGNDIVIGEGPPYGRYIDKTRWIPIARVLAVTQRDPEYRREGLAQEFYSESWALVHLMMFERPDLGRSASVYLRDLDDGIPETEAYSRGFTLSKDELDRALLSYVEGKRIKYQRLRFAQLPAVESAPLRLLPPWEADRELAGLMVRLDETKRGAQQLIDSALKAQPDDARGQALRAAILIAAGDGAGADTALERALASHPTDPRVLEDSAGVLLAARDNDPQPSGSANSERAHRVRDLLGPFVTPGGAPLGLVYDWAEACRSIGSDLPQVLAVVERELPRAPRNLRLLWLAADLNATLGHAAQAREHLENYILAEPDPESRLYAQKMMDSDALTRALPARSK
jgi:tetratricopeptide (TPR) repeat protein